MIVKYLTSFYMIPVISKVESYDIFIDRVKVKCPVRYMSQRDGRGPVIVGPTAPCDISLFIAKWNKVSL